MTISPTQIYARSQQSAYLETGPIDNVCLTCTGPVRVAACYDDTWKTPITQAHLRIADRSGVIVDGGPKTLGLINFGMQDGQNITPIRPQLGTFQHPQAQHGPVAVALVPDASAKQTVRDLEKSINADLAAFAQQMQTSLTPWIKEWESSGWWGVLGDFFDAVGNGLVAWWEGEGEFWASAWETIKSIPDAVVDGVVGASEAAVALWNSRDKIFELMQAFAEGAVDQIESLLAGLVNLPGEIGQLITDIVKNSAEWASGLIEMVRQTSVLDRLFATMGGIILMIPPNFWAEAVGTLGGYLIPEIIISVIFAVIAFFTAGTGAAALSARLTVFVAKTASKLAQAGRVGNIILRIFAKLKALGGQITKLIVALRKNIDEAVDGVTSAITRIVRRSGRRVKPPVDLPCFNKPKNATWSEFRDQLQEQENAINNSDLSELIARRNLVKDIGTGALRDLAAQKAARTGWINDRALAIATSKNVSRRAAKEMALREASKLDATHVLDIVAGGDPSAISGLQSSSVNRSLGPQWRSRVDDLDDALADHVRQGGMKANIRMKPC
jgi:hypothetical protein